MNFACNKPAHDDLLEQLKRDVAATRWRAQRTVNTELVGLYWRLGHAVLSRQQTEGLGTRVLEWPATDLRATFPAMRGLSRRNLVYMRTFASASPTRLRNSLLRNCPGGRSPSCSTSSTTAPIAERNLESALIDRLFSNSAQSLFVVIELQIGRFQPEHTGQLGFYVAWVDESSANPPGTPTIGTCCAPAATTTTSATPWPTPPRSPSPSTPTTPSRRRRVRPSLRASNWEQR